MWKLMKLEWKKNQTRKYMIKAAVLVLLLGLFQFAFAYFGIANDPETGVPDAALGSETLSASVELLTNMSYLLFTGVMLSSFIVSAYKNGTMKQMFIYPIRRQKILLAQMLAVWSFCFTALFLTKLLIYGSLLAGSYHMSSAFPLGFHMEQTGFWIRLVLKSASTVTIGFLSLSAGMAFRSSKAPIIASILLIFLTQANIGDFTLSHQTVFSAFLMLAALGSALWPLCRAEKQDIF